MSAGVDGAIREPVLGDRFAIRIRRGGLLSTATYFNTFFETHWRRHTALGPLRLRVEAAGAGTIRLVRRRPGCADEVLDALDFRSRSVVLSLAVPEPWCHPREAGRLHFEIAVRSASVRVSHAEWVVEGEPPPPVRLAVGICTLDRPAEALRAVEALLADPAVAGAIERVIVVDQGTRPIRHDPAFAGASARAAGKFRIVEQANLGGAGGFTRAILEADRSGAATHMLLMDDDAVAEPESVFRACAFLGLALGDTAVGAPMLDAFRPLELHEAGATVRTDRLCSETATRLRVDCEAGLAALAEPIPAHYCGWWFFAFRLGLIEKVGLPLPLFLRGDDAEFGYRLFRAGIPPVTLPGLGVWHEPFVLRTGGWQAYYDFRNMLVLAAVHGELSGWRVAAVFLRRFGHRLLRFDYREAAHLCAGVADFCRGASLISGEPGATHHGVLARHSSYPLGRIARSAALPALASQKPWPRYLQPLILALGAVRQTLLLSPRSDAAPTAIAAPNAVVWADVVAIDGGDPDFYEIRRRSRSHFLRLLGRGLWQALRLALRSRRPRRAWREAGPRLMSKTFWHRYLGMDADDAERRAA